MDQHRVRVETRRLWASTALVGYLDWPGAKQVLCLERTCVRQRQTTRQVRYASTSLGPEIAAATLLDHLRGHWAIENRLHWVRDVTFGEDACQVRRVSVPQVLVARGIASHFPPCSECGIPPLSADARETVRLPRLLDAYDRDEHWLRTRRCYHLSEQPDQDWVEVVDASGRWLADRWGRMCSHTLQLHPSLVPTDSGQLVHLRREGLGVAVRTEPLTTDFFLVNPFADCQGQVGA